MAHQHEQRADLAGEHALTDIGQLIGVIIFLAVWAIDSFIIRLTTFPDTLVPVFIRAPITAALMVLAGVMAWVSHRIIFTERRDPPSVITTSFFRFVRHPLYLSEIIIYLGLFILTCSLACLPVIIAVVIFLNHVAGAEEKLLEKRFGRRYLEYKQSTGKWFPNLRRMFSDAQKKER